MATIQFFECDSAKTAAALFTQLSQGNSPDKVKTFGQVVTVIRTKDCKLMPDNTVDFGPKEIVSSGQWVVILEA